MTVLTPREQEILEQVSHGKPAKQIGNDQTVKNQLILIRAKLGANNTAHAVAIGLKMGVIK